MYALRLLAEEDFGTADVKWLWPATQHLALDMYENTTLGIMLL